MVTSTEKMPLFELYEVILEEFKWFKNNKNEAWFPYTGKDINDEAVMKLMLENNGCAFTDKSIIHLSTLESTPNYVLGFMWDAKANLVNNYYDYIEFFGTKYLIIFMDYFENFFNPEQPEIIGRSVYFDAIKKIVDVFISTTTSAAELMGSLSTTAASNMYRFAGVFIASLIIDELVGLNEDDVSMIAYDDLKDMITNISPQLLLLGVKYLE
jgi:hypothetical protein